MAEAVFTPPHHPFTPHHTKTKKKVKMKVKGNNYSFVLTYMKTESKKCLNDVQKLMVLDKN